MNFVRANVPLDVFKNLEKSLRVPLKQFWTALIDAQRETYVI